MSTLRPGNYRTGKVVEYKGAYVFIPNNIGKNAKAKQNHNSKNKSQKGLGSEERWGSDLGPSQLKEALREQILSSGPTWP